jgi:hypothetical protein
MSGEPTLFCSSCAIEWRCGHKTVQGKYLSAFSAAADNHLTAITVALLWKIAGRFRECTYGRQTKPMQKRLTPTSEMNIKARREASSADKVFKWNLMLPEAQAGYGSQETCKTIVHMLMRSSP